MTRPKRDAPISYRPPQALREAFRARVLDSGLTANAFITRAVFGQAAPRARRVAGLDGQAAAMLLAQAARISDHLKSLSAKAEPEDAETLRACHEELREIRTCLMDALGRRP